MSTGVGDEGGFAPELGSADEAIGVVLEAAERVGHRRNASRIALDPASTELFRDGAYHFERAGKVVDTAGMIDLYARLLDDYPIVSIEDGLAEDEWDAWRAITERLGDRVQLVGDDLFVTNTERLERGIGSGVANAILVKVNQIGTLTESLDVIERGPRSRLCDGDLAPLRRNRGHDDRRHRRRDWGRPDQDRRAVPHGQDGQVQPAAADRGRARAGGRVPGLGRVPALRRSVTRRTSAAS